MNVIELNPRPAGPVEPKMIYMVIIHRPDLGGLRAAVNVYTKQPDAERKAWEISQEQKHICWVVSCPDPRDPENAANAT